LTGATVGTITAEAVAFAIGAIDGLLEIPGLDVAGVDVDVPFKVFGACGRLSEECAVNDMAVGD
jgi:hypothetical protein